MEKHEREAAEHLLKAVHALTDAGYCKLSEDAKRACNWANMARELLVRPNTKPPANPEPLMVLGGKPPDVTVGGAGPAQQIRMNKAARRWAKRARKTGQIYS